jgi:hypothetical protein
VASCSQSSCVVDRFPRQKYFVMFRLNADVQSALEGKEEEE